MRTFGQNEWVERLTADGANLGAAARWYLAHDRAPLPHMFRLLSPFGALWPNRGLRYELMDDPRSSIEQLLPSADSFDPHARAELLFSAEVFALEASDVAKARAIRDRLVPLLERSMTPLCRPWASLSMRGPRLSRRTSIAPSAKPREAWKGSAVRTSRCGRPWQS